MQRDPIEAPYFLPNHIEEFWERSGEYYPDNVEETVTSSDWFIILVFILSWDTHVSQ